MSFRPFWLAAIWAFKSDILSFRRRVELQPGSSATARKTLRIESSSKTPLLTSFIVLMAMPSCQSSVASGATRSIVSVYK